LNGLSVAFLSRCLIESSGIVLVLVVVFVLPIGVISGVIVLAVSVLVVSSLGSMTGSSAEDVVTKGDATGVWVVRGVCLREGEGVSKVSLTLIGDDAICTEFVKLGLILLFFLSLIAS